MQWAPTIGFAKDMNPHFLLAMQGIFKKQQGVVEKNLFRFGHRYPMLFIFPGIATVPVKTCNQAQIRARVLAIAKGAIKPKPSDPKVRFTSMRSLAEALSQGARPATCRAP